MRLAAWRRETQIICAWSIGVVVQPPMHWRCQVDSAVSKVTACKCWMLNCLPISKYYPKPVFYELAYFLFVWCFTLLYGDWLISAYRMINITNWSTVLWLDCCCSAEQISHWYDTTCHASKLWKSFWFVLLKIRLSYVDSHFTHVSYTHVNYQISLTIIQNVILNVIFLKVCYSFVQRSCG